MSGATQAESTAADSVMSGDERRTFSSDTNSDVMSALHSIMDQMRDMATKSDINQSLNDIVTEISSLGSRYAGMETKIIEMEGKMDEVIQSVSVLEVIQFLITKINLNSILLML